MDFFQNNSTLASIITLCSASVLCPLQPFWPPCPDLGDKRQLLLCRRGQARLVWHSPGQDRATRARRAEHAHSHSPLSTHSRQLSRGLEQGVVLGSFNCFLSHSRVRQLQLLAQTASCIQTEGISQNYLLVRADVRNQTSLQISAKGQGLCFEMILCLIWTLQNRDYQKANTNYQLLEYLKVGTRQAYVPK